MGFRPCSRKRPPLLNKYEVAVQSREILINCRGRGTKGGVTIEKARPCCVRADPRPKGEIWTFVIEGNG